MSVYLKDEYKNFDSYVPGEQPDDKSYIKLNTNESPYPPGEEVLKLFSNIGKDIGINMRLYPDPEQKELKGKIAESLSEYDENLSSKNIFVGNGSDDILNFAFNAYSDSERVAVFPDISYGFYKVFAQFQGVRHIEIPLKDNLEINVEDYIDLERKYQLSKAPLIVIANPNAPTGISIPISEIERILKSNPNSPVLIDEAYVDFGGVTAIPLLKKYENLIVARTFSKSSSLAGGRLGYAVSSEAIALDLELIKYSTNPYSINRMTEAMGIAVLNEQEYYKENCKRVIKTRERTASELKNIGFKVIPSTANFLFVKNEEGFGGEELYRSLKEKGILVRWFNKDRIRDYLRITVGTDREMDILIETLKEIVKATRVKD